MSTTSLPVRQATTASRKPYKGIAMEGPIASWYAKVRTKDEELAMVLEQVGQAMPEGGKILEVAPGPGYLAVELARMGRYQVVGLDISKSFVEIARTKAREAGVQVDFRQGNASAMPFDANIFDFAVCRAAFKNFADPVGAIQELSRVLVPGGKALISDLRRDATLADIRAEIAGMELNRVNAWLTEWTFKHMLLKGAYTKEQIRNFVAQTNFGRCTIEDYSIGMHIWLVKPAAPPSV